MNSKAEVVGSRVETEDSTVKVAAITRIGGSCARAFMC